MRDGCTYHGRHIESCFECPLPLCKFDDPDYSEGNGPLRPSSRARGLEMLAQGHSVEEVMEATGRKRSAVYRWLAQVKAEHEGQRHPHIPATDAKLLEALIPRLRAGAR